MTQFNEQADVDVVVVGTGFVGIYATHYLRDQLGLAVRTFEAGSDVGGTWFWNRYPGARCDIESAHYSYSFSEELQSEWKWSERYAAQPEILAYLNHVADKFDIRRSVQFNTRITSMVWDDAASVWHVGTDAGETTTARFIVSGAGNLSIPKKPEFPGIDNFKGQLISTHRWPHEPVDLAGKRVGIIGTGASGIQVIQTIASEVGHLTVFQRTPNFACPLRNRPVSEAEHEERVKNYPDIREGALHNFMGIVSDEPGESAKAAGEEERKAAYDRMYYDVGGFHILVGTYGDLLFDKESNDTLAEYLREQIAKRVEDPSVAAMLTPHDHPFGTKRAPMETNYFEVYNRDNVTLVDVRANPIQEVTEKGVRVGDTEYEFDVLISAMGFNFSTGALLEMGVVGRNGLTLNEKWADGPETYLGIASHGFPNFFMITGPQSHVALTNNPLAIEDHVNFASETIRYLVDNDIDTIEPTAESETEWVETVRTLADATLFPLAKSFFMGANIPGKPISPLMYLGGSPTYRALCYEIAADNYRGFALQRATVNS
ncbi:NAD(P)/FAD-dependent oxidoreductase [Gordonia sp. TBRC 11910]|uniref:NAD(P)/FAD-dependent oxidoreductase n=1 Tax=Gordonia asplenii TaxID=2725283 RepID=A0A848L1D1_9ACTN|nr:NAD(P)/FAD-dependent oxidoreductase [Gordonia asplenii]NMO04684.1 NAD(P)/FAD-dependent oxidoreductase [Gordonia asplenii]